MVEDDPTATQTPMDREASPKERKGSVKTSQSTVETDSLDTDTAADIRPVVEVVPPNVAGTNGVAFVKSDMPSKRRLHLRIVESGESDRDRRLLDQLVRTLLEHNGHDEVDLEIATSGRVILMEWPRLNIAATDELMDTLRRILGDSGGVRIES